MDDTLQASRPDVADYRVFLAECGFTEAWVRSIVEDMRDHVDMPPGFEHLAPAPSSIEGVGVFSAQPFEAGDEVGPARIEHRRTLLGRRMNHARVPNCEFVRMPGDDLMVRALVSIPAGQELTISYRQALQVNGYREHLQRQQGGAMLAGADDVLASGAARSSQPAAA